MRCASGRGATATHKGVQGTAKSGSEDLDETGAATTVRKGQKEEGRGAEERLVYFVVVVPFRIVQ